MSPNAARSSASRASTAANALLALLSPALPSPALAGTAVVVVLAAVVDGGGSVGPAVVVGAAVEVVGAFLSAPGPAPVSVRAGGVTVDTRPPGATVEIDGVFKGATPMFTPLSPGCNVR